MVSGIEIKESVENLDEIPTNDIEMVENLDLEKKYIEEVANKVKINKKLKVVLDAGNGAAGILAEKMFTALGHEVISINKEPDGATRCLRGNRQCMRQFLQVEG